MSNPYKIIYELRETIAELSERCREQEADIEELLKEREWISVKDRLPEKYFDVLVYTECGNMSMAAAVETGDEGIKWEDGYGYLGDDVTYWMPLPQKPESENDAE
jgi:hypothetical protein